MVVIGHLKLFRRKVNKLAGEWSSIFAYLPNIVWFWLCLPTLAMGFLKLTVAVVFWQWRLISDSEFTVQNLPTNSLLMYSWQRFRLYSLLLHMFVLLSYSWMRKQFRAFQKIRSQTKIENRLKNIRFSQYSVYHLKKQFLFNDMQFWEIIWITDHQTSAPPPSAFYHTAR